MAENIGLTQNFEVVSDKHRSNEIRNQTTFVKIRANGLSGWRFIQKYFVLYVDSAPFSFCMRSMAENIGLPQTFEVVSDSN